MTDTTILPTVPAYVQIDHRNGHGGHHHNEGLTVKDRLYMDADANADAWRDMAAEIAATAGVTQIAIERNGRSTELAVEKTAAAGLLGTNVAAGALGVAIERTAAAGILNTNVVGQQIQNTQLQNFNLASVQAQTFYSATNLAIEKTAAAALLEATKNAAAAALTACQNAGAAALTAATNTAAIQAAIAECCCETRELIRADGEKTRDLTSNLEALRLASKLQVAENEINLLKIKVALPAIPAIPA